MTLRDWAIGHCVRRGVSTEAACRIVARVIRSAEWPIGVFDRDVEDPEVGAPLISRICRRLEVAVAARRRRSGE